MRLTTFAMNPSARIQAVIELLEKTAGSRIPMDATIGDYMRGRRYIGAKDRADIVERVYNIVRRRARLGWWLERIGAEDTPRTRVIAWLTLAEKNNPEKLFDGGRFSPHALNADEQKTALSLQGEGRGEELIHPDMPESVRLECPPEHEARLRAAFGDDFAPELQAMMGAAPLDLRVNTRHHTREDAKALLEKDGVKADATPFSPFGLRARGKVFLSKTKAFTKGIVEIQDEGSQLISYICGAKPGMQVLDYCAGAGGKTLALASCMNNKGRVVATDTEKTRLERARGRFKRAGVHDIIEARALSDEKNRKWLRRQKETFDLALADAPCSGSGTWRRNPDTRWRAFGPSLGELVATQAEILDKIAKTVKPGGRLVYATCSLFREENEAQVEGFLARHPSFELVDLSKEFPAFCAGPMMRLTPRRHNTDGFFAAALIKTKNTTEHTEKEKEDTELL